jgi:hypothetical protein
MGFFTSIGKILFFPIYGPYKAIKKYSQTPEENPIVAVVTTSNPQAYEYYFSGLGHETDMIGNSMIVWKKGLPPKEKTEVMNKLMEKLKTVI